MFCSECGLEINDPSIRFCPECGTRVDFGESETSGVIFTHIGLLSERLHTDKSEVLRILSSFVERKRSTGVDYRLVDVGNYTFQKKEFLGFAKTARLKKDSPLKDYMDVLMDSHRAKEEGATEVQYLFIIGSSDIIPMPKVKHFVPNGIDNDIETDILWAYPYGAKMLEELENQNLFKYKPLYHVGRLPFAVDGTLRDLCDYLERDLNGSFGIPLYAAYGQCDPNWMRVSGAVSSILADECLLPDLSYRLSSDCCYEGLILSPKITSQTVGEVLDRNASIYYFNLHGGSGYESRGYFGNAVDGSWNGEVIVPEHMSACRMPNVVFSEACYGARFIGLDKNHSMMLSSLSAGTLVFVGSSRVAWGTTDTMQGDVMDMSHADVLAHQFLENVVKGATVAEAFFVARSVLLAARPLGNLYTAASIVEFNLFGDPTLKMNVERRLEGLNVSLVHTDAVVGCTIEEVPKKEKSILDLVRGAVNLNIREIRQKVDEHLYSYYGIDPRPVNNIFKVKYADGTQELLFDYILRNAFLTQQMIVTVGLDGQIKKVYASK